MKRLLLCILFIFGFLASQVYAQTSAGIGIYPTGTETGIGYRSAKESRVAADIRITKANLFGGPSRGSFINEASAVYRVVMLEKVRFHIGLGARAEWAIEKVAEHKFGGVLPVGVEAFPFPFQNAGLFFEAAPFYTTAGGSDWNAGIRTVAGFVFYFPSAKKTVQTQ